MDSQYSQTQLKEAENIVYELWYVLCQNLFNRVVKITNLTQEQAEALKYIALKPNDFQINITK